MGENDRIFMERIENLKARKNEIDKRNKQIEENYVLSDLFSGTVVDLITELKRRERLIQIFEDNNSFSFNELVYLPPQKRKPLSSFSR